MELSSKKLLLFTYFLIFGFGLKAGAKSSLYDLDHRLMQGDKSALFVIAEFLDSKSELVEYLGYHRIETTEDQVARRILRENCMFLDSELRIDTNLNTRTFLRFLRRNDKKIYFSDLANAFIITPFIEREAKYEIETITEYREQQLQSESSNLISNIQYSNDSIAMLLKLKDPRSLLLICSVIVKERNRFNRYHWDTEKHLALLEYLTGTRIGVETDNGKINAHIEADYSPTSRINLLSFMVKHYSGYTWDSINNIFTNPILTVKQAPIERILFEKMVNKSDSNSMNAFITLSEGDPNTIKKLCREYKNARIETSYPLPLFPYKFLHQLVDLTEYCRIHGIDYKGDVDFIKRIDSLKNYMHPWKRYHMENRILERMTLEQTTPLEYWSIVYQYSGSGLSLSAGRILDKFYSTHWQEIIKDSVQLGLYLKKMVLYDHLGIIGSNNDYHVKFAHADEYVREQLSAFHYHDSDIIKGQQAVLKMLLQEPLEEESTSKSWTGNMDHNEPDFIRTLDSILRIEKDTSKYTSMIQKLLSRISYNQIGTAIRALENVPFKYESQKYTFIYRDFGLEIPYLTDDSIRAEFLNSYSQMAESEFYAYTLDWKGVDYSTNGNLDFNKIYTILKYDVGTSFLGNAGWNDANHVYAVIKLLELKFETTLGYPVKLCNSMGLYSCDCYQRAYSWMKYLESKNLVDNNKTEAPSFNLPVIYQLKYSEGLPRW